MSDDHFMLHEELKSFKLRITDLTQSCDMFKAERDHIQKDFDDLTAIVLDLHKIVNLTISQYMQNSDAAEMLRILCYIGVALQKTKDALNDN